MNHELTQLGDAMERSAAADLRPSRRRRHVLLAAAAVAAVAIPSVAIGARLFTSTHEVEQSMPAGARILIGTDPTCTVVKQDVEYHCVLARPPVGEITEFKGTVYNTVDATKHVNGGCRSLRSDGLVWQCYLGQAAVDQKIISQGFLGEYAPAPSVG